MDSRDRIAIQNYIRRTIMGLNFEWIKGVQAVASQLLGDEEESEDVIHQEWILHRSDIMGEKMLVLDERPKSLWNAR